jgi:hypothetical protein
MGPINPEAALRIQPELTSGESVLWAGQPNPSVIFHSDDWMMIPFSLLWGGFAIFWEAGALGFWGHPKHSAPGFFALWGIPFVVIGQYLIWGRFLYDAWIKRRTYYAVTDRRIVVLQEGRKRKISSTYISAIPRIEREDGEPGTLWFGQKNTMVAGRGQATRAWNRFSVGDTPVFADIDDLDSVYRLIVNLRERGARTETVFSR